MGRFVEHPSWAIDMVQGRNLSGLVEALASKNTDVAREAAWGLGCLGDKKAVDPLMGATKQKDADVRRCAAEALGLLSDRKAVKALLTLTEDREADVRGASIWALGALGDPSAVPALVKALADDELYTDSYGEKEIIGWQAASSLASLGAEAGKSLVAALKNKNPRVRANAARALGYLESDSAIDPLLSLLDDKDREVKRAALNALAAIRSPRAFDPVLSCLEDRHAEIRWSAVLALGQFADTRATPRLLEHLKSDAEEVRYMVCGALSTLKDPRSVKPLISVLAEGTRVSEGAARALGEIGDEAAVPHLVKLVDGFIKNAPLKASPKVVSKGKKPKPGTKPSRPAAKNGQGADPQVVLSAISSLGVMKARGAMDSLARALTAGREEVRAAAASALGNLGSADAVKSLERSLLDSSKDVRASAARALEMLTGRTYL